MTQRGIVTQINGTQITVLVARQSMCGENCASCKGGCMPSTQQVHAVNQTGEALFVGDSVLLETETGKVLGASAAVYLVPLVCLFASYYIAQSFTESELVCALLAVAALFISLFGMRLLDRAVHKNRTLLVQITEILRRSEA